MARYEELVCSPRSVFQVRCVLSEIVTSSVWNVILSHSLTSKSRWKSETTSVTVKTYRVVVSALCFDEHNKGMGGPGYSPYMESYVII